MLYCFICIYISNFGSETFLGNLLEITASFLTDCADTGALGYVAGFLSSCGLLAYVAGFLSSCGLLGCVDGSFSCPTRCKLPRMSS